MSSGMQQTTLVVSVDRHFAMIMEEHAVVIGSAVGAPRDVNRDGFARMEDGGRDHDARHEWRRRRRRGLGALLEQWGLRGASLSSAANSDRRESRYKQQRLAWKLH